jgi:hypothetical protein
MRKQPKAVMKRLNVAADRRDMGMVVRFHVMFRRA